MGMNVNKLKGKIVEKGLTIEAVADMIGMNSSTLYRKMRNGGKTMLVHDATAIAKVLELSSQDAMAIFFSTDVA